MDTTISAKVI